MRRLRGPNCNVEKQIQEMIDFQAKHQSNKGIFILLKDKTNFKALLIMLGLQTGFRATGINAILFYTASILEEAQISVEPNLAVIFFGVSGLISTIGSSLVVDRLGRRTLLLFSNSLMSICLGLMGVYFLIQSYKPEVLENVRILPAILLCLYLSLHTVGYASVLYVVMGEIFAQNVKGLAAGISMAWNNFLLLIISIAFPVFVEMCGSAVTFFIFSFLIALACLFIFFCVPETKGKSLEQIQMMLLSSKKQ